MSMENEGAMEQEERIGCNAEGFTLVNQRGREMAALRAGDSVELFVGNGWQRVRVQSGGYKGWYYVTPDGRMARFALSMLARGYQASAASEQEDEQTVQQPARKGERKRTAISVELPETPQPDRKPVRRARRASWGMAHTA